MATYTYPTFTDGTPATPNNITMLNEGFNVIVKSIKSSVENYGEHIYSTMEWDNCGDIMNYGTDENKNELIRWANYNDKIWHSQTNRFENNNDDENMIDELDDKYSDDEQVLDDEDEDEDEDEDD